MLQKKGQLPAPAGNRRTSGLIGQQMVKPRPQSGSASFPERQAIGKNTGNELLRQLSTLLQAYAPNFEQNRSGKRAGE